jgi:DNA-3-methyladenine glycosylase II
MTSMTSELTGTLPAVPPFRLDRSIGFLRGFAPCQGDQVLDGGSLTKAISLGGQAVAFRVSPYPSGIRYRLHADGPVSGQRHGQVAAAIDHYLSLSDDLTGFYQQAAGDDPAYAALVARLHGLHQVRFLTLAEVGTWMVLTQRTPAPVALAARHRITAALGRTVRFEGHDYPAFPELGDLMAAGPGELQALTGSARKAGYLTSMAEGLAGLGEDYLRGAPYPDAVRALRRIRGIGEFSAAGILLRGLGRMDDCPVHIPQFARAAAGVYGSGFDSATIRGRYGRQLGYWAYYLRAGTGSMRAG